MFGLTCDVNSSLLCESVFSQLFGVIFFLIIIIILFNYIAWCN